MGQKTITYYLVFFNQQETKTQNTIIKRTLMLLLLKRPKGLMDSHYGTVKARKIISILYDVFDNQKETQTQNTRPCRLDIVLVTHSKR